MTQSRMKRVLIANRGEIACRIARTCKTMGLETVAIFSAADRNALHVSLCDRAIDVGPSRAADSYLNKERILKAAEESGSDTLHPGYGFLAESAEFARGVTSAGLTWIGPSADHIAQMGDKASARDAAVSAGLPVLPGSSRIGANDLVVLEAAASVVGFPLLIKAVAGGGGIGMQLVSNAEELGERVVRAMGLAERAFGSNEVYLERYVPVARHVEVQVLGDGFGRAVHLFERDCSIQRRFQKIIEEATAPSLSERTREAMRHAAVTLAANIKYAGLGTVEFILDVATEEFFFLEMNTRIQVEHPVTEMITGEDLVRRQILVAQNVPDAVPEQPSIHQKGHAIECRIYAEWPEKNFAPSPGEIKLLDFSPNGDPSVRIDTGYRTGDAVPMFYDPMIAKVICWGEDRQDAINLVSKTIAQVKLDGIKSNLGFLQRVLAHPAFGQAEVHTSFIEKFRSDLLPLIESTRVASS